MGRARDRLPGYELIDQIGSDATGIVWRGRDSATGEPVEVRRLAGPSDLLDRERARRAAAAVAAVEHLHLAPIRRLIALPTGIVLVSDAFAGGSLAALLATRGRLSPAEVVTIGGPLADALAALHGAGLAHGRVTPEEVRFTPAGRPVLTDTALGILAQSPRPPLPGFADPACLPGAAPVPSGDVHDLAAVCVAALTGKAPYAPDAPQLASCAPPALADALAAALRGLAEQRCSAAELSAALLACPAEPVRLAGGRAGTASPLGAGRPAPSSGSAALGRRAPQRRSRRGVHRGGKSPVPRTPQPGHRRRLPPVLALVGTLALLLLVVGLLALARPPERTVTAQPSAGGVAAAPTSVAPSAATPSAAASTASTPGPTRSDADPSATDAARSRRESPDWRAVLAGLDELRSRAFAVGDAAQLRAVYAPDAPAFERDQALLHDLVARGARARGLRSRVLAARSTGGGDNRAVVRVTDLLEPYAIVGVGDGARVRQTMPGRGRAEWVVTLVRAGGRWRVYDVRRWAERLS